MRKGKAIVFGVGIILVIGLAAGIGRRDEDGERPFAETPQALPVTAERLTLPPLPSSPEPVLTEENVFRVVPATAVPEKQPPCPETSTNQYNGGLAYQFDQDNPVRPAARQADKNLSLRGYALIASDDVVDDLFYYGRDDPTQPPQLATLFMPHRLPEFVAFYRVHHWRWQETPNEGQRADLITLPPVTALGLQVQPGETLHTPVSGYNIGGGMAALVIFADADTVALRYTREDSSGSRGYTVHIDQICTDPNLLQLYNALDAMDGPRYQFVPDAQRPYQYNLPELAPGQPLGTANGHEVVVAIVDSGSFMDPRSCDEWWQIRPKGIDCASDIEDGQG